MKGAAHPQGAADPNTMSADGTNARSSASLRDSSASRIAYMRAPRAPLAEIRVLDQPARDRTPGLGEVFKVSAHLKGRLLLPPLS